MQTAMDDGQVKIKPTKAMTESVKPTPKMLDGTKIVKFNNFQYDVTTEVGKAQIQRTLDHAQPTSGTEQPFKINDIMYVPSNLGTSEHYPSFDKAIQSLKLYQAGQGTQAQKVLADAKATRTMERQAEAKTPIS